MSKELSTAAFDYSVVEKDVKGKLIALSGQVKRYEKDFIAAGMEIGQAISEAHAILAGDGRDGKFKQWIELETGLSRTTAYDWMHAYERAKKCPVLDTFPATVACLMAAPSVTDEAIKEFAKQVDKGVKPTVAAAKATIERFREIEKPKPIAAKKLPSQSDEPATPAEDEPKQYKDDFDTVKLDKQKVKQGSVKGFDDELLKTAFRKLVQSIDDQYKPILALYEQRLEEASGNRAAHASAVKAAKVAQGKSHDAANDALLAYKAWRDGK